MNVNTKYKDSVFSFLFSTPDLLRELYCAMEAGSRRKLWKYPPQKSGIDAQIIWTGR